MNKNETQTSTWFKWIIGIQAFVGIVTVFCIVTYFCEIREINKQAIIKNQEIMRHISIEHIQDILNYDEMVSAFEVVIDEETISQKIGNFTTQNYNEFMMKYYEHQNNQLSLWLTILGFILALFTIVIPISFMKLYEIKAKELKDKMNSDYKEAKTSYVNDAEKQIKKFTEDLEKESKKNLDTFIKSAEKRITELEKNTAESAKQAKISELLSKAHNLFTEADKINDNNEQIKKYSEILEILKNIEKGFNYNIKKPKIYGYSYNNRGLAYFHSKKYDLAINDYKKVIETNPSYDDAYYNIVEAYIFNKNYKEALDALKIFIKKFPDSYVLDDDKPIWIKELKKALKDETIDELLQLIEKLKVKERD